jgi:hypothetical protein
MEGQSTKCSNTSHFTIGTIAYKQGITDQFNFLNALGISKRD